MANRFWERSYVSEETKAELRQYYEQAFAKLQDAEKAKAFAVWNKEKINQLVVHGSMSLEDKKNLTDKALVAIRPSTLEKHLALSHDYDRLMVATAESPAKVTVASQADKFLSKQREKLSSFKNKPGVMAASYAMQVNLDRSDKTHEREVKQKVEGLRNIAEELGLEVKVDQRNWTFNRAPGEAYTLRDYTVTVTKKGITPPFDESVFSSVVHGTRTFSEPAWWTNSQLRTLKETLERARAGRNTANAGTTQQR